jgi:hypothetical protein
MDCKISKIIVWMGLNKRAENYGIKPLIEKVSSTF